MSKLLHNRLFRFLVCLLVICCLVINVSPIRTEATIAASIAGNIVTVNVVPLVAASLVGLGVGAVASSSVFDALVTDCVSYLQGLGLCQEFTIEVFGYDINGISLFGIAPEVIDVIRGWLFDNEYITESTNTVMTSPSAGSGFKLDTSEGYADGLNWLNSLDIYSMANSAPSNSCLLVGKTSLNFIWLSRSSDSAVGIDFFYYGYNAIPSGYSSADYPVGSFQAVSGYSPFGGICCLNYSDAIAYDAYLDSAGISSDYIYYMTPSSKIYFVPNDYLGLSGLNRYVRSTGEIQYDCLYRDEFKSLRPIVPLDYASEEQTSFSVVDGLTAGQIAPKDENLAVGYPEWYANSKILTTTNTDTGTEDQVLVYPVPYSNSISDYYSLPQTSVWEGTLSQGGTDTGTDTEWQPPEDPGEFALDLSNVFPFCIPFDLYDFLTCLNADPVAPVIQWELALPGGGSYPIELDLSPFDSVAQLLRRLQLLLFCVALAIKTRDLIKG